METKRKTTAELIASMMIAVVGASVTSIPPRLSDYVFGAVMFLLSFGFAISAAIRFRRFGWFGRSISLGWLTLTCVLSALSLWRLMLETSSPGHDFPGM